MKDRVESADCADLPLLLQVQELPFEGKTVRKIEIGEKWFFAVDDVVNALREDTGFLKALGRNYTQKRDQKQFADLIRTVTVAGEKVRVTDAVGMFRLVQGVRGAKAEGIKRWIAQVMQERVLESANPSLAVDRAIGAWYRQGRDDVWVMERLRSLHVRKEFTDEMKTHGTDKAGYAILTNIVHQRTFELSVADHKALKGLDPKDGDLRENMSHLELIFSSLGEASSTAISKTTEERSFESAKSACVDGGSIARDARRALEKRIDRRVVTSQRPDAGRALPGTSAEL